MTVTGNATPAGTIGVDIFTRTVDFGTAPANTSFHEPDNTFTGVPGSTHDYFITLIPDADWFISSVDAPTLPAGIVANGAPFRAGENWEIPIQVTIGAANDTLNITQNAITVTEEPYSVTFNVNNIGILNAVVTPAQQRITFDEADFGDSITPFVISVTPTDTFMFDSVNDIDVDINEAQVQTPDGVISLSEAQFAAAISPAFGANGQIEITISGNFPTVGSNYTLDINIVGDSNTGFGASTVVPATAATTIRSLTPGISSDGGSATFEVVSDGAWNASIRVASGAQGGDSDNGQFNLDLTSGGFPARSLVSEGSYSPTAGLVGTHLITVIVGQEPFYLNPAGNTGAAASQYVGQGLELEIRINARNPDGSDGALLASASVFQNHTFGGRLYTAPSTWTANEIIVGGYSTDKPSWTFYA